MYRPLWHPLSAVRLVEPACAPSRRLLTSLLASRGHVTLRYRGDRMWPAVQDGQELDIESCEAASVPRGSIVLAWIDGRADLFRVGRTCAGLARLVADADPEFQVSAPPDAIVGVARGSVRGTHRGAATRRLWLDLREAWTENAEGPDDPADSVREKYDRQAAGYARSIAPEIEPRLHARLGEVLPGKTSLLVVGSGAGRESLALARDGHRVTGLDFSPDMIRESREAARHHGLTADFLLGDVRNHEFPAASFGAALFTYDVYSFVPRQKQRVRVLEQLRSALRPGGVVFLSARIVRTRSHRALLALQHRRQRRRVAQAEPGDSHTRWFDADEALRHSYVHLFTPKRLASEVQHAGYRLEGWEGGHGLLRPR